MGTSWFIHQKICYLNHSGRVDSRILFGEKTGDRQRMHGEAYFHACHTDEANAEGRALWPLYLYYVLFLQIDYGMYMCAIFLFYFTSKTR